METAVYSESVPETNSPVLHQLQFLEMAFLGVQNSKGADFTTCFCRETP